MLLAGIGPAVEKWASERLLHQDNLKVILVAAIIVAHAIASYAEDGFWSYAEMREVTLSPVTGVVLLALVPGVISVFVTRYVTRRNAVRHAAGRR